MPFEIMELPYVLDALEPVMSKETVNYHYNKHHKDYVKKLNELIEGTPYEDDSLEDLIRKAFFDRKAHRKSREIFNNAAQVWNHDFFWNSMAPAAISAVPDRVKEILTKKFKSMDEFNTFFIDRAKRQFGSGWVWLLSTPTGEIDVTATSNAMNPIAMGEGYTPLLVCDVWEHAYYLDYQNKRVDMVGGFLEHLINWTFVEQNLDRALNSIG